MPDSRHYTEAVGRIEYIEMFRHIMITTFDSLCEPKQSGMPISQSSYKYAVETIDEIIKEIYHQELGEAQTLISKHAD